MRIIAGNSKGKKISALAGPDTRPTSDRVRENIFNIIYSRSPGLFTAKHTVLDLFAGTGALGLEALSRGMGQGVFIDNMPGAVSVIRKNIDACGYSGKADVLRQDIIKTENILLPVSIKHIDLIFMDPPYYHSYIDRTIEALFQLDAIDEQTLVVAEHEKKYDFPASHALVRLMKTKTYGKTAVTFFTVI